MASHVRLSPDSSDAHVRSVDSLRSYSVTPEPPPGQPSDSVLLQQVLRGDRHALRDLWGRWGGSFFNIAVQALPNRQDAAEVLQELLIRIWQNGFDCGTTGVQPYDWAKTLLRSLVVDSLLRSGKRSKFLSYDPNTFDLPGPVHFPSNVREGLQRALGDLPKQDRQVLEEALFGRREWKMDARTVQAMKKFRSLLLFHQSEPSVTYPANDIDLLLVMAPDAGRPPSRILDAALDRIVAINQRAPRRWVNLALAGWLFATLLGVAWIVRELMSDGRQNHPLPAPEVALPSVTKPRDHRPQVMPSITPVKGNAVNGGSNQATQATTESEQSSIATPGTPAPMNSGAAVVQHTTRSEIPLTGSQPRPMVGANADRQFLTPWVQGEPGRVILIEIEPVRMRFATKEFTAKKGERLSVTISNRGCPLQHNWLLLTQGSLQKIGKLADEMLSDAKAVEKQFVPMADEVLVWTDLIAIGQSITVHFNAPGQIGNYPYICTFPGHWRTMRGILRVVEEMPQP